MIESLSISLTNGDHSDSEIEKSSSPSITINCECKNEGTKQRTIDFMESSSLETTNYELTDSTQKPVHYPLPLKSPTEQSIRKRGFLASELSNSDKGTFSPTSPSRTSPANSSSVSSSSPASTGSCCNRDEVNQNSRCDESDVCDNSIVKRARSSALLQEEDPYAIVNLSTGRCASDCSTLSLNSKPKYRQRLNVAAAKKGFVEPPENSSAIRSSTISTDDNGGRCLSLPKVGKREVNKINVSNTGRLRSPKTGLKRSVLQTSGNRVPKKELLTITTTGIDDDFEREMPVGSELIIAAYNNFVRRVVDDTLDRNITFCEQPRHAITALENICARAWPTLEMKRHRNRIRAYLKACRRNSKKNRGQINMKEPAMNGLSIEARQLVANALNLVANEVEQLKLIIQDTNKSTFPPNSSSPGSSKDTIDSQYLVSTPTFGPKHKRTDAAPSMYSEQTSATPDLCSHSSSGLSRSHVFSKDYPGPPLPFPYQEGSHSQMPNPAYLPSGSPYFSPVPYSLDASYMAAMLRLLPTLMQYNKPIGSNISNSLISSPLNSQVIAKTYDGSNKSDCSKSGVLDNFDAHQFPFDSAFYGVSEPAKRNTSFLGDSDARTHAGVSEYNYFTGRAHPENSRQEMHNSAGILEPPPAHMNSIQFSPSLQEAIGKLLGLDVCLTQDDTAYFRHNLTLAQEAIKYARAFSHMVLSKIELLEAQLQQPSQMRSLFTEAHPLNLS